MLDKDLLNYNAGPGSIWSELIEMKAGVIVWEDGSHSGPPVDWRCTEVKVKEYAPNLGKDFRLLTKEQFIDRTNKSGEQGASPNR